jgi:glucuronate isomerase
MKSFIDKNFMLNDVIAEELYYEAASGLPIIDYHHHLDPSVLAENKNFKNLAEIWINHDPYKHRAMRINGIPENEITGNADDKKKYENWAKTVRAVIENLLFAWSNLELKRFFDIDEVLTENNADAIWERCNEFLKKEEFRALNILERCYTEMLCTSDDLLDDLTPHQQASKIGNIRVLPSLRADSILAGEKMSFYSWLERLEYSMSIVYPMGAWGIV